MKINVGKFVGLSQNLCNVVLVPSILVYVYIYKKDRGVKIICDMWHKTMRYEERERESERYRVVVRESEKLWKRRES